ncbi:glycosyltransferase family 2 protein, partial [Rhodalgimonas zhirmunskyi]
LRHGQDLGAEGQADRMAALHYPEYSTFIFFGLSYARFRELGYPPAFFLRGDDIEYSLRHGDAGGRCLSNPNLCAWHEPAHSYGQEYMSIAHGVIINMAHGNTSRDDFLRFFQARMMAHGNLYDAQGLRLYGAVLRDLNSRSVFLEHDFASHYIEMLGEFRKFDATYRYLPEELRADLRDNAHERGVRIVEQPFLYPGLYAGAEGGTVPNRVLLENPHTG